MDVFQDIFDLIRYTYAAFGDLICRCDSEFMEALEDIISCDIRLSKNCSMAFDSFVLNNPELEGDNLRPSA